jgi:hypothetical protein
MQASAPIMSAFVLYLLSLFGGITAWLKTKTYIKNRKYGFATLFALITLICATIFTIQNSDRLYAQVKSVISPAKMMIEPNKPIGVGKGIFPGRVVWVHKPGVSNWDEQTGFWFEDRWNSQEKANEMIREALISLTGQKEEAKAWKQLFAYFNKSKNRGNHSYQSTEKIAIKINQNHTFSHEN